MTFRLPFELNEGELLCVVGPTASQKTELAIRICEQNGGEVIGADSVQIYDAFDIGSGKPTLDEQARARHHLVGIVNPHAPVDAAQYAALADSAIRDVYARGKVPVVCGGAFLWVRALVHGLAEAPAASQSLRERLNRERRVQGDAAMHRRLREIDPDIAERLNPNDWLRVQRALEVFELSGRRLSELHREHQARESRYRARFVGIRWKKALLEERIRLRAKNWLASGWIDEVRQLVSFGYKDTRPMLSVGYRQVVEYLDGLVSYNDLLDCITRATKVFARRQRTWLRDEEVCWLEPLVDE